MSESTREHGRGKEQSGEQQFFAAVMRIYLRPNAPSLSAAYWVAVAAWARTQADSRVPLSLRQVRRRARQIDASVIRLARQEDRRPSLGPIATTPERRAEIRESSAAIRRHRRHTQAVLDALCGRHYSAGKKVAERKMVETRGDA